VASPLSIALWAIALAGFVLPIVVGKLVKTRMLGARRTEQAEEMDVTD
jgi:putative tricarboxylic transport membrane protein